MEITVGEAIKEYAPFIQGKLLLLGENSEWLSVLESPLQGKLNSYELEELLEKVGLSDDEELHAELIRLEEGKKKQAKGNAIERAVKNHSEISLYCHPYDYYPYVVFASGCDFEDSSSINDRLDSMTDYEPRNQEYIFHEDKLATIWIREKQWTNQEIYDKLKDTAEKIVYHIISYEQ